MRLPDPLFPGAEYAKWKSGEVESLVILWVRLPPRSWPARFAKKRKRLRSSTATTPARHAGSDDSTPSGINSVIVWQ